MVMEKAVGGEKEFAEATRGLGGFGGEGEGC